MGTTEARRAQPAPSPAIGATHGAGQAAIAPAGAEIGPSAGSPVMDPGPSAPGPGGVTAPLTGTAPGQAALPAAPTPPASPPAAQLAQALPMLQAGGAVELTLRPAELGSVQMVLADRDGMLVLQIAAERDETLALLRRHADDLAEALTAAGWTALRLDFGAYSEGHRQGEDGKPDGLAAGAGATGSTGEPAPAGDGAAAPGAMGTGLAGHPAGLNRVI